MLLTALAVIHYCQRQAFKNGASIQTVRPGFPGTESPPVPGQSAIVTTVTEILQSKTSESCHRDFVPMTTGIYRAATLQHL